MHLHFCICICIFVFIHLCLCNKVRRHRRPLLALPHPRRQQLLAQALFSWRWEQFFNFDKYFFFGWILNINEYWTWICILTYWILIVKISANVVCWLIPYYFGQVQYQYKGLDFENLPLQVIQHSHQSSVAHSLTSIYQITPNTYTLHTQKLKYKHTNGNTKKEKYKYTDTH